MTTVPPRLEVFRAGRAIALRGEIDAHSAPSLDAPLGELGVGDDVQLEMSGVEFIDSSGLRLIIEAHERLRVAGKSLILRSPSMQVRRLIEVSGLEQVFTVVE